jgi:hypothetical protein
LAGKRRFGEFQKSLGLAKNILSSRLRKLISYEIMESSPATDGSAHNEYQLTDKGRKLHLVLVAIWQWGESALFAPGEIGGVLCDVQSGQPLPRMQLLAKDGRILRAGDTVLRRDLRPSSAQKTPAVRRRPQTSRTAKSHPTKASSRKLSRSLPKKS